MPSDDIFILKNDYICIQLTLFYIFKAAFPSMSADGPPQRGNAGVVSAEQLQRTCITGRVSVVERRRVRHSLYEIPRPLRSLIRSARPLRHIRQCSRRYRYLPERKSETAVVRKVLQRKPWCIGYVFLCDDFCQLVIECLPAVESRIKDIFHIRIMVGGGQPFTGISVHILDFKVRRFINMVKSNACTHSVISS